jgi:post-segregation antitoxin (ccd killing protein)
MPKKNIEREKVNVSLPIGLTKRAKEFGINVSYHSAKGIQDEIEFQEKKLNKDL